MKKRAVILGLIVFLSAVSSSRAAKDISPDKQQESQDSLYSGTLTYLVGPGDVLEIKVWRHSDLDITAVVRPDGKISFPLVGNVNVCDLTTDDVEKAIESGLSATLNQPKVNVNVRSFQSKKIFVLGEVNKPGVYPFEGRVTVLDALSKASGYKSDTAALKSVMVIRKGYSSKPEVLRLNVYEVIAKGRFSQNIYLQPYDIIFVPKSFIANVNTFVDQFFAKTDPALQYYLDIYEIGNPSSVIRSR